MAENKSTVKEYTLSVDEFNRPKEFTDLDALAVLIIRLFLLKPGTLTNNPECGIGLYENYSHITEDDLGEFNEVASDQLTRYIGNKVQYIECNAAFVPGDKHTLIINVNLQKQKLSFAFDKANLTLSYIKDN